MEKYRALKYDSIALDTTAVAGVPGDVYRTDAAYAASQVTTTCTAPLPDECAPTRSSRGLTGSATGSTPTSSTTRSRRRDDEARHDRRPRRERADRTCARAGRVHLRPFHRQLSHGDVLVRGDQLARTGGERRDQCAGCVRGARAAPCARSARELSRGAASGEDRSARSSRRSSRSRSRSSRASSRR